MKRVFLLVFTALAALMAASCQKEEMGRVLTATIEQYEHNSKDGNGASKAYINDDHYACWENNDKVKINGTEYTVSIPEGTQGTANTATINGASLPTGQNLLAYYPASQVTDWNGNNVTISLPQVQQYRESNGHQVIDNPMAAYCPDGGTELRFRNLCALLKVTIVGSTSVKGIQVKGIDNQMLWGKAQLMLNNQGLPMLTDFTNGSNSVTLTFTTAVTINGSKSFYIVVPAASNFNQLTIAVLTTDGTTYANNSKTSLIGQSLSRNQIGAISYTPNGDEDATFTPDWMIRYTGTAQVTPYRTTAFGSPYLSSYFSDGNGYLLFEEPLTQIDAFAFYNCSNLSSISFPANLTTIGNYAFNKCSNLSSISFPANLTTIGNTAFQDCISLASISFPANLTSIGSFAFYNCSNLSSISFPANLTTIGDHAFYDCSNLTSISFPENLTSIGGYAFRGCSGLTSISLPENLTSIDVYAFVYCTSLTTVYANRWVENGNPEITPFGYEMFYDCPQLSHIYVPAGAVEAYKTGWGEPYSGMIEARPSK